MIWNDNSFDIQAETKTSFLNLQQADQLWNISFQLQAATKRNPKHASSFQRWLSSNLLNRSSNECPHQLSSGQRRHLHQNGTANCNTQANHAGRTNNGRTSSRVVTHYRTRTLACFVGWRSHMQRLPLQAVLFCHGADAGPMVSRKQRQKTT